MASKKWSQFTIKSDAVLTDRFCLLDPAASLSSQNTTFSFDNLIKSLGNIAILISSSTTLDETHVGKTLYTTGATNIVLTLPVLLGNIGAKITVVRGGTGTVTISAGGTTSLNGVDASSVTINDQFNIGTLFKYDDTLNDFWAFSQTLDISAPTSNGGSYMLTPGNGMLEMSGAARITTENSTSPFGWTSGFLFAVNEMVAFSMVMPSNYTAGSDIFVTPYYAQTSAGTSGQAIAWTANWATLVGGGVNLWPGITAPVSTQSLILDGNFQLQIANPIAIPGAGISAGMLLQLTIQRSPAVTDPDYPDDVRAPIIEVRYT